MFARVNSLAAQCGYLVHPDCCTNDVLEWLRTQYINPNSTFYKSWNDIVSKSRAELALDQILHYMSTYGTDFTATPYVPNNDPEIIPYNTYKIILPITEEELYKKCLGMLTSGIALSNETIDILLEFVEPHIPVIQEFPIDDIKNKEAQARLCKDLGITPKEKFALLRYIVYSTTGSAMIIQNKATIAGIKNHVRYGMAFDFSKLSKEQITSLSSIFLRFKNIFLAFKGGKNSAVINKMRRLAVKTHTPLQKSFWDTVVSTPCTKVEIQRHLHEINTFRKVSLYQATMERMQESDSRLFIIRNQKSFVKKEQMVMNNYHLILATVLRNSIIEDLKSKKCAVRFTENLNIACPTSEKNFIGNLPIGSSFNIVNDALIGIYWREEWGTRDFDLSFTSKTGSKVGWNAAYRRGSDIIFSGDMTSANPEATEIIMAKNPELRGIFQINRYYGKEGSKFRFFYADEKVETLHRNYMVDPNSIKVSVEMTSDSSTQQALAIINEGKVSFMNLGNGSSIVSSGRYSAEYFNILCTKTNCFLSLKEVLLDAGFWEATEEDENVLDLNDLQKDTLIKLFSKEGE